MSDTAEPRELVEYARDRLRTAILTNRLRASDSLSQVQLAKEFGISRTPLREAVRLLEYEGLATAHFNKRVTVSAVSPEDLDSLYAMRITLESLAIHANVPRMDAGFIAGSEARLVAMGKAADARDFESWSKIHREFHLELVSGRGERMDRQILQGFDHGERYRRLYLDESAYNWTKSMEEHVALHTACAVGDRAGAARLLTDHYVSTAVGVLAVIDPDYAPDLITAAKAMARSLIFLD